MKIYLIARVSTDEQAEALPAQTQRLEIYAARKNYADFKLLKFTESAFNGKQTKLLTFLKEVDDSQEPSIIVFDKVDRLTRDWSSEVSQLVTELYRRGKAEFHFPSDNLFIHRDSPATDIMHLGLNSVVAQYYSNAISDNVKRRIEQKLRDGEWIGKAPFGYKNVDLPNGKKWVEIDGLKADAVRSMFEWYATGLESLKTIKKKLTVEYAFELSVSQIDLILHNTFYHGEMRVKGKLYPHKYDTVIGLELFNKVELVRGGYKVNPRRWGGLPFAYRGLIKCAEPHQNYPI